MSRKPATPVKTQTFTEVPPTTIDVNAQYSAVLHTSCGDIDIALDAKQAPVTVNSFLFLVQNEYYNGTTFHRIVTDFVDQGGDQKGDGTGDPGYKLPDEPPKNGYKVGDVAMANSGPGTSGSQFFLVVSKNGADHLGTQPPYKYSILGHMDAHGLKVAQKINTFGSARLDGYAHEDDLRVRRRHHPAAELHQHDRRSHHHGAGGNHHPRAVSDAGVGSTAR